MWFSDGFVEFFVFCFYSVFVWGFVGAVEVLEVAIEGISSL